MQVLKWNCEIESYPPHLGLIQPLIPRFEDGFARVFLSFIQTLNLVHVNLLEQTVLNSDVLQGGAG